MTMDSVTRSYHSYLKQSYFPALDALRAFCILIVITVHTYDDGRLWRWLGGGQGVTIFFVLSGYLITTLALREERRRGSVSLRAFYVRRCCRILPLYYLTLGLYCLLIFGFSASSSLRATMTTALPYFASYLPEVPYYTLHQNGVEIPFVQSWSLGVEEKFYLIWPVLGFVVWRAAATRRLAGTILVTACFALAPVICTMAFDSKIMGRCLFAYYPILVGCVTAQLLDDERWFRRLHALAKPTATLVVSILFVGAHLAIPWVSPSSLHAWRVLYALTVAALLVSVLLGHGWLQRALDRPVLVFIGRLSYGIYLIHIFGILLAYKLTEHYWTNSLIAGVPRYILACLLSIAGAWLLHWAVEKPCIALGRRWSEAIIRQTALANSPEPEMAMVAGRIVMETPEIAPPAENRWRDVSATT
jgi:peptidoglycan/LPS O-acetylase OafA/YrhL